MSFGHLGNLSGLISQPALGSQIMASRFSAPLAGRISAIGSIAGQLPPGLVTIDPGFFRPPSRFPFPFPFPTPTPTPTPTPVATAPGLPADLTTALGDIPTAEDGDVISADFHNSLRNAIVAMAGYLGDTAINHQVVLTLAPSLLGSG